MVRLCHRFGVLLALADFLLGLPLSELEPLSDVSLGSNGPSITGQNTILATDQKIPKEKYACEQNSDKKPRTPNTIVFLRRHMLYGRTESKRKVPAGLGQTRMSFTIGDSILKL